MTPVGRKPEVSPLIIGELRMQWRIVVFNVKILKMYTFFSYYIQ